MSNWTVKNIPPQHGRRAVITGATGGLGYETALALAGAGADVVLTGRSDAKGLDALARIRTVYPDATISFENLDLASLAAIAAFAEKFAAGHQALDLLVNNGGVMAPPTRQTTPDGFELQFGTNYLSHFALTALLLPLLLKGDKPRVVNVSSGAHTTGQIDFDDLQGSTSYKPFKSYSQSKLANLMFALELQRHSDANGWGLMSNAAHPGLATTELITNGMGKRGFSSRLAGTLVPLMGQSPAAGALPQLYAATDAHADNAGYYGPGGFLEFRGPPAKAKIASQARDAAVAARLWAESERLTGVHYPALAQAA